MAQDVSNIIRRGQVSSVNPANNTVRVAFDDMRGPDGTEFVSGEPLQPSRTSGRRSRKQEKTSNTS